MNFLQSELGKDPVVAEALFRASPSRVYKAWTEPDQIMKWFGPEAGSLISADIDLRVGGKWRFVVGSDEGGLNTLQGTYQVIDPDNRIVFTWQHVREHADGSEEKTPESTVTVVFEAHGKATRVHLRHESIVKRDGRLSVTRGWERTFTHLQALVEAG